MSDPLVLVGAGGLGREVAEAVRAVNAVRPRWELVGFLDDGANPPAEVAGLPVLGSTADLARWPDARLVLCTGRPDRYWSRKRLAGELAVPDDRYATIVHPAASLSASVVVGVGSVVLAGVVGTATVVIGDHVVVMPGCVFTHDDVIGDHATFGAGVRLAGGVTVGEGAYVGSGVLVKEHSTIGAWSLVGMGSVVLGDVPAGEAWVGAPARHLRTVDVPADVVTW